MKGMALNPKQKDGHKIPLETLILLEISSERHAHHPRWHSCSTRSAARRPEMITKRHMHPTWPINKPKHPAQISPQPGSTLTLPPSEQEGWSKKEVMQGTPRTWELREWKPETRGLWDSSGESKTNVGTAARGMEAEEAWSRKPCSKEPASQRQAGMAQHSHTVPLGRAFALHLFS